jgi:hypothetical protein
VLDVLDAKIKEGEQRLRNLTQHFVDGNLTSKEWQVAFARQLKTLYGQQAALGAGGWDRLTPQDFGRMGGHLRAEYARLPKFAQDVLDERFTEAQFLARARMYGGKARAMFEATDQQAQVLAGKSEARRILGATDAHCEVCLGYAGEGWKPVGYFPYPGSHPDCYGNCYCTTEYR